MKITIKIPVNEKGKFKLQSRGNIKGRQFKTGAGLLQSLERALLRLGEKEKLAIKVLEYEDGSWTNVNETIASVDANYLLYAASCFLEDYLSKEVLKRVERQYLKTN